jgi:hypothetical protein
MEKSDFPLGTVIAERRMTLYDQAGKERQIAARLGEPVLVQFPMCLFRCPFEITGLDFDRKVFAPAGGDAFIALQYSLDFIGELIKDATNRLMLQNKHRSDSSTRDHWIWRYPADQDKADED